MAAADRLSAELRELLSFDAARWRQLGEIVDRWRNEIAGHEVHRAVDSVRCEHCPARIKAGAVEVKARQFVRNVTFDVIGSR